MNSEARAISARVRFNAAGGAEKWNPETGDSSRLAAAGSEGNTFDLNFLPWEAYFVVFDRTARPSVAGAAVADARSPQVLSLDGPWTFQVAATELDYRWAANPGETRLEIPVADFRLQKGEAERLWHRIKITDSLNPQKGAARYLSSWDAPWITRYFYDRNHPGELAGPDLRFSGE